MTSILISLAVAAGASTSSATLPMTVDVDAVRTMTVQHNGRWMPLDTVARDTIESVTGAERYQGSDPVRVLLAMTFNARAWTQEPMIPIGNAELRAALNLPADKAMFSYQELVMHQKLHELTDQVARKGRNQKLNPLESKVGSINGKLGTLQAVLNGGVIRPVPHPNDAKGAWKPVPARPDPTNTQLAAASGAWQQLGNAFKMDDRAAFARSANKLIAALNALPAAYRPTEAYIQTELWYNRLDPYRNAWMLLVGGAVVAAAAMVIRRAWADALTALLIALGFGMLSYGIRLRWELAGHIPASNMFESMLFLSWGMALFSIISVILFRRQRLVALTSSFVSAIALMLADILPMDYFIRPTAPVLLDTAWMAIHVPVIMVSYSVLALGVVIAHAQLITMAVVPERKAWMSSVKSPSLLQSMHMFLAGRRRQWIEKIDSLHYWYIHIGSILLLAGIVTGSMWAASSWGRYWGWDPKEVWSLVALLGYLTILHVRIDTERVPKWAYVLAAVLGVALLAIVAPKLAPLSAGKIVGLSGAVVAMIVLVVAQGPFSTAVKSVLAFWMIIMTYVGVNYVLGIGLHSYGFGTGAVVKYMFRLGGADLALVLLCTIVYLARRYLASGPSPGVAPAAA